MAERSDRRVIGISGNGLASENSSTGGGSMLDISTKLGITEAELAIVRNEVSELVAEKNALEVQCRKHENSWKFALVQLGRTIEERNEALSQLSAHAYSLVADSKSPEIKVKKMKAPALKVELENCLQQLETQNRVARQIENERDKANDELEFAKSQISTLMMQHADLMASCAEVANERNKALSESRLLREELNKYDQELHSAIEAELGKEGEICTDKEKALLQQIRSLRDENNHLERKIHNNADFYQRQIAKCNMDKKQTSTSADAMKALLQRKLEEAQSENTELRSELRASSEVIIQLQDQLAQVRIACQHRNGYAESPPSDETLSSDPQSFQGPILATFRNPPPLSQETGMSLYNMANKTESPELITPAGNIHGYRVSSARKNPYVPTASPFPEESREDDTSEEEASWI